MVIALMAAQAVGRAVVRHDRPASAVAVGALVFMLSDSLLATNKFAFALPMAQFGVFATYYVAQILIACNARPAHDAAAASPRQAEPPLRMPAAG